MNKNLIITYISVANKIIKDQSSSNESTQANHSCHHNEDYSVLGFKLPVIKIPNFDGTYYKWLEFKETFYSLVHNNERIKNIHKFHYLNSYLEGEAARVICNLEISDQNYSQAWQLLCERFDNKRQLINNHLNSLCNFESVRETNKSLRFIIDHVTKNLRALSSLGLPTESWDVLIIHLVTAKLDNPTYLKWEEHRNSIADLPTLDDFFSFLKNRADVLESIHRNKLDKQDKTRNIASNSQPKMQTKSFFITSKGISKAFKIIECMLCKAHHRLYECPSFKSKTPEERISFVSSMKLCENCLRTGHDAQRCTLPGTCRSCKKRHNSLLHLYKDNASSSSASNSVVMSAISTSKVLLCTAKVQITNPITNDTMTVRALLDSGSQSSFITESAKQKLKLSPQPSNISIVGIGNTPLNLHTERCALHLQSKTN